jgi:hypothetical protein
MIWNRRYDSFSEWLAANPEPDLQALVERWGGFSRVPVEQWLDFDRRMARWREAYRKRHEDEGDAA